MTTTEIFERMMFIQGTTLNDVIDDRARHGGYYHSNDQVHMLRSTILELCDLMACLADDYEEHEADLLKTINGGLGDQQINLRDMCNDTRR